MKATLHLFDDNLLGLYGYIAMKGKDWASCTNLRQLLPLLGPSLFSLTGRKTRWIPKGHRDPTWSTNLLAQKKKKKTTPWTSVNMEEDEN